MEATAVAQCAVDRREGLEPCRTSEKVMNFRVQSNEQCICECADIDKKCRASERHGEQTNGNSINYEILRLADQRIEQDAFQNTSLLYAGKAESGDEHNDQVGGQLGQFSDEEDALAPTRAPATCYEGPIGSESLLQDDEMRAAIQTFVFELLANTGGKSILKHVQYISDIYGFSLSVRHSKYRCENRKKGENDTPLERGIFVCKSHRNQGCRCFISVITTTDDIPAKTPRHV